MLAVDEILSGVAFFTWWSTAQQSNDFWIENDHEMIRVHVTPRRHPFNPSYWKTSDEPLKDALLGRLKGERITEALPCLGEGTIVQRHEDSMIDKQFPWSFQQWIGRSRFPKSRAREIVTSLPPDPDPDATAMLADVALEDGQGPAAGRTEEPWCTSAFHVDGARAETDPSRVQEGGPAPSGRESFAEGPLKSFWRS